MQPYLFYIESKPKPNNLRAEFICGAIASIWVFDKSKALAQEKASNYINYYGWDVVKIEHSFLPTPEYIASLDEPEAQTYRKAELNGISAQFDVLPKEPRQGIGYLLLPTTQSSINCSAASHLIYLLKKVAYKPSQPQLILSSLPWLQSRNRSYNSGGTESSFSLPKAWFG